MSMHLVDVSFDVIDIILNVTGGILGYFFWLVFSRMYIKMCRDESLGGESKYFYEICYKSAGNGIEV